MGTSAHVRVGVVATAAFLALLLFGLIQHKPASAEPISAPAVTASPTPEVPQQPEPGFGRRERRGPPPGFWGGGPDNGGQAPDAGGQVPDDGGQQMPAPSTEGATES